MAALKVKVYTRGAHYVDRDLPVDRKGSMGRSHDIKKIDGSMGRSPPAVCELFQIMSVKKTAKKPIEDLWRRQR